MSKLDLKLEGTVAVVTMDDGDNKLNLEMVDGLLAVLDRVEKETDAAGIWKPVSIIVEKLEGDCHAQKN